MLRIVEARTYSRSDQMVRNSVAKTLEDILDVEAIRIEDSQGNAHSNTAADSFGRDRSLVGNPLIPMQKLTQDSRISWAVSALRGGAYRYELLTINRPRQT